LSKQLRLREIEHVSPGRVQSVLLKQPRNVSTGPQNCSVGPLEQMKSFGLGVPGSGTQSPEPASH